jgi:hypothetical protein
MIARVFATSGSLAFMAASLLTFALLVRATL